MKTKLNKQQENRRTPENARTSRIHHAIGMMSAIISILSVIWMIFWSLAGFISIFIPIVAIILGAVSGFGKSKELYGKIGFYLGLIVLLIMIFLGM
jgi:hypothetical protein